MGEILLSRNQAAAELDCHPTTVSRWIKSGALPGIKIGGKTYVNKSALQEMIAEAQPVKENTGAPGAKMGKSTCHISAPTRRTGGSCYPHQGVVSRLDDLLGRKTGKPPKR